MKKTYSYFLIFLLFITKLVSAQDNYVFELVTIRDRANFGDVQSIYEDPKGIIWMGIYGKGLAYYNGQEIIRYFLPKEYNFAKNNDVFIGHDKFIYLNDGFDVRILDPILQDEPEIISIQKELLNLGELKSIAVTKEGDDVYVWGALKLHTQEKTGTKYHILVSKNREPFVKITTKPIETLQDPTIKAFGITILSKTKNGIIEITKEGNVINNYTLHEIDLATINTFNWKISKNKTIWIGGNCKNQDIDKEVFYNCDIWKKEVLDTTFIKSNYSSFDTYSVYTNDNKTNLRFISVLENEPYKFLRESDSISFVKNLKRDKILNISKLKGVGQKPGNIFTILKSKQGLIWVGGSNGLSKLAPQPKGFNLLPTISRRSLIEDEQGAIYGSVNFIEIIKDDKSKAIISKIVKYTPKTNKSETYLSKDDGEGYWFQAVYKNGYIYHNAYQRNLITNELKTLTDVKTDFGHAYLTLIDRKERLWKAHWGNPNLGIYEIPSGNRIKKINIPALNSKPVDLNDWYQRPTDGTVWLGTYGQGVFVFSEEGELLHHLNRSDASIIKLRNNVVSGFYEDKKGNMWLGHGAGLSKISPDFKAIKHFTFNNNHPESRLIYTILPQDNDRYLWLSTSEGIFRFDCQKEVFEDFPLHPEMMEIEFNRVSALKSSNGVFYYGTSGTLTPTISFSPKEVIDSYNLVSSTKSNIIISEFSKFDGKKEKEIKTEKGLQSLDKIELKPNDKYFNLSFLLSDFRSPENNYYSYYLKNYDKTWNAPKRNNNHIKYENLPPGNYTLKLRSALLLDNINANIREIKVIVFPFWYQTLWARSLFIILFLSLGYLVYRYNLKVQYKKQENLRLKEISNLKTRLYTNITHEFRTPLTVIMGMNDTIKGFDKERNLIKHNAKSLLQLINQLLELSKLDSRKIKLKLIEGDVVVFIKYLTESFYSMASEKKINLSFNSDIPSLMMKYDETKLQHIIYNLVSNSIKFTKPGGKINVYIKKIQINPDSFIEITVKDTGIGIPKKEIPFIFDRFYQVETTGSIKNKTLPISGTGIGLALTKELIDVMDGQIKVESEVSWGTKFTFILPIIKSNIKNLGKNNNEDNIFSENKYITNTLEINQKSDHIHSDKPLLLIIEDNKGIISYIKSILQNSYNILTAINGQEGIDIALERIPDIIISDVMMPEKNGYEVCNFLKLDEKTNHIPIIILTAKADIISKIKGLEKGADVYLSKPFEREELEIQIKNLLELRKKLQKRYSSKFIGISKDITIKNYENENSFILKVQNYVEKNIQDSDLSVKKLSEYLKLSQIQTYRKIKALTGQPPVQFIRTLRLQKALGLLKSSELNISEIAYEIGFNDPNYFTRIFKKTFGFVPGDLRDNYDKK